MLIAAVALLALVLGAEVVRVVQVHLIEATRAAPAVVVDELVKRRYVVTLLNEANFAGVLLSVDPIAARDGSTLLVYRFDQCTTVPTPGGTPEDVAGCVIIESTAVAYLQQVG